MCHDATGALSGRSVRLNHVMAVDGSLDLLKLPLSALFISLVHFTPESSTAQPTWDRHNR